MNWELYRREDGSLNIIKAWEESENHIWNAMGEDLLITLEHLRPVTSRQIAALAVSIANQLGVNG